MRIFILTVFSVFTAFGQSITATRNWTSNFVSQAVTSGDVLTALYGKLLDTGVIAIPGDMTTVDGITTVYRAETGADGTPEFVASRYRLSVSSSVDPQYHGAVVVSSALEEIPPGTLYAYVSGGMLVNAFMSGGAGEFVLARSGDGWYISGDGGGFDWRSIFRGDRIQGSKWDGVGSEAKMFGTFSIAPRSLTAEEYAAIAGVLAPATCDWCAEAANQSAGVTLSWEAETAPVSRVRMMRAAPSPDGPSVNVNLFYAGPGMVNYNELFPPDKDEEWRPAMGYLPGAWEEPSNWIPQIPVKVEFVDLDRNGNPVVSSRTIPSVAVWNAIVANYYIKIPPYGYTYPRLVKKFTCTFYGHVWGAGCICRMCGEKREHVFEFVEDGKCAVCVNKLSDLVTQLDGEIKVVESKEVCGSHDESGAIETHTGWHHEGSDDDEATMFCSCACGVFSPSGRGLAHELEHVGFEQISGDDGLSYHYNIKQCVRDDCMRYVKEREGHVVEVDAGDTSSLQYIDSGYHWASGTCRDCGQTVEGRRTPHSRGYYGTGVDNYCKCPCMGEEYFIHEPIEGTFVNPRNPEARCDVLLCAHCGVLLVQDGVDGNNNPYYRAAEDGEIATLHQWSFSDNGDGVVSRNNHYCACGSCYDAHIMSAPIGGVSWCEGGMDGTPACDFTTRGADKREGEDSGEIGYQPKRPTRGSEDSDDPDDPGDSDNPNLPPIPTLVVMPGPNPPLPPDPNPPPPPMPMEPIDVPITPLGRGDSTTVDPNVHRNDFQVVSMPYPPPPMPVLLPMPPDFSR